jgi:hyperosmotically inducible protein
METHHMKFSISRTAFVICLATMAAGVSAADEPRPTTAAGTTSSDTNSRTVGTTIDDATITAKVKAALFTDELTKARNINVDTMRSTVTLRGMVESQAEAERAERIANSTEGVKSVKSELKVAR